MLCATIFLRFKTFIKVGRKRKARGSINETTDTLVFHTNRPPLHKPGTHQRSCHHNQIQKKYCSTISYLLYLIYYTYSGKLDDVILQICEESCFLFLFAWKKRKVNHINLLFSIHTVVAHSSTYYELMTAQNSHNHM